MWNDLAEKGLWTSADGIWEKDRKAQRDGMVMPSTKVDADAQHSADTQRCETKYIWRCVILRFVWGTYSPVQKSWESVRGAQGIADCSLRRTLKRRKRWIGNGFKQGVFGFHFKTTIWLR